MPTPENTHVQHLRPHRSGASRTAPSFMAAVAPHDTPPIECRSEPRRIAGVRIRDAVLGLVPVVALVASALGGPSTTAALAEGDFATEPMGVRAAGFIPGPTLVREAAPTETEVAPEPEAVPAAPVVDVPAPAPPPVPQGPVTFATFQGLDVVLPTNEAIIVGWHEAYYPTALGVEPVGLPLINDNLPKFANRPQTAAGPNYVVMSSRGRANPATSAVDIAVPHTALVHAPVTGTVINVERYELYGQYPDLRIDIRPDARPDLTVTMLHTTGRLVQPGARVEAGVTPVADHANLFPFRSHVDAYAGGRHPHIHIEVKAG